ncbi:hypothetical protein CHS0354_033040 [Potamilus streckersoni]|uniref:Uncharacterized protein n=1 Tax=Potamilus streckersoni TaxID=2493646 RepID=A0AAE0RX50_9BIVA|nr:hypothetical protein CHS0354_033040 [Potamilus streckersoni]
MCFGHRGKRSSGFGMGLLKIFMIAPDAQRINQHSLILFVLFFLQSLKRTDLTYPFELLNLLLVGRDPIQSRLGH